MTLRMVTIALMQLLQSNYKHMDRRRSIGDNTHEKEIMHIQLNIYHITQDNYAIHFCGCNALISVHTLMH